MAIKKEFGDLYKKLKVERDEIKLQLHLASMEAKEEFEKAEKQWVLVKARANEIADDTKETTQEFIAKARIVGEELKDTYHRIKQRLS